jgi:hypothetical membrane protein
LIGIHGGSSPFVFCHNDLGDTGIISNDTTTVFNNINVVLKLLEVYLNCCFLPNARVETALGLVESVDQILLALKVIGQ